MSGSVGGVGAGVSAGAVAPVASGAQASNRDPRFSFASVRAVNSMSRMDMSLAMFLALLEMLLDGNKHHHHQAAAAYASTQNITAATPQAAPTMSIAA